MTRRFGNRATFAMEVGKAESPHLVLIFAFWRPTHPFPDGLGTIFVARIPPDDFATTLQAAAELLDADFAR
jgi:hypothetical protein